MKTIEFEQLKDIAGVSADEILNDAYDLLTDRLWNVTAKGVKANMNMWLEGKSDKIREMVKSPYYNGNLQLVIPVKLNRAADPAAANFSIRTIYNYVALYEDAQKDDKGKTAEDYLREACKLPKSVLPIDAKATPIKALLSELRLNYQADCRNSKTLDTISQIQNALGVFRQSNRISSRVTKNEATELNRILNLTKKKIIAGQKTSKIVRRILGMCQDYSKYNSNFTTFADQVNERLQDGYFVVSLNFLDYLRMSDGNSWSSCQTTDWKNTRHMDNTYHGMYVQGTLSYANDNVSYVTYFLPANADIKHPEREWKVYRIMFHVQPEKNMYIMGRVYPQSNDGDTAIKDTMNSFFKKCMGFENAVQMYYTADKTSWIHTVGGNYPDYEYGSNKCTIHSIDGNALDDISTTIGHYAVSCKDGYELDWKEEHGTIV